MTFLKRIKQLTKPIIYLFAITLAVMLFALGSGKIYQNWDDDPTRGAIAFQNGAFGESYSTPIYLPQGWSEADSLWYYNTTQGSNLLPYDLFMALEMPDSEELVRSNAVFDRYRYLPQKPTFFNPDGLAVGFVKDTYQGKDYIGYTCAACHTGQINYKVQAIRIDGGPAVADMVGYLTLLQQSMEMTLNNENKRARFVDAVLKRGEGYNDKLAVIDDLSEWTGIIQNYNIINHSSVDYGYARLDAFGRIYNRVLQHVINKDQARTVMLMTTNSNALGSERMLTSEQVERVLEGVDSTVIGNKQFSIIVERLLSAEPGYPRLSNKQILRLRNALFNEPDAPVSYPFLWDITHSDYIQWNGLANNAGLGPLGRNAGEVTGVFATLDWKQAKAGFNLGAKLSGQDNKSKRIDFTSSINLVNLKRLEGQLRSLQSPVWPEQILGSIDKEKAQKGQLIYARYCQSCHEVIQRDDWNRIAVAKMSSIENIGTDKKMATNSVVYKGKSGNFQDTYQSTGVGDIIMGEEAPVAMILTATTKASVATPDADKWIVRRWLDWLYTLGASFFENKIKPSIKQGNYIPDTTANPFNSLLSYKARPLNGIWATAPYLHNGSVPTLYDLLLPADKRSELFCVGRREIDIEKVGIIVDRDADNNEVDTQCDNKGTRFLANRLSNLNSGHEYAAGKTPQPSGQTLPALNDEERWQLLEYMKQL